MAYNLYELKFQSFSHNFSVLISIKSWLLSLKFIYIILVKYNIIMFLIYQGNVLINNYFNDLFIIKFMNLTEIKKINDSFATIKCVQSHTYGFQIHA
jgi:hypothetical protein